MPENRHILGVAGDSVEPTVGDGDIVLVELARTAPTPPGVFVRFDGLGSSPSGWSTWRTAPADGADHHRQPVDGAAERPAEEVTIVGRIRWFAREI